MVGQNSHYLESKVLTAPPQRLHLMLLEGAIRFSRQAEQSLRGGDALAASAPLLRSIEILGELLAGVRQQKSELNERLADFYWFIFRRISEAKINLDVAKLSEAIKLLEYERETWLLVCEKAAQAESSLQAPVSATQTSRKSNATKADTKPASKFSFEA